MTCSIQAYPILAIHDVGAGGLSNAFPELVNDAGMGAHFQLRDIPLEESGMSPKEIWCNESQERYVLAIAPESLNPEQARAHTLALRNFVLSGAELKGATKLRFAAIQERLAEISQRFSEHVLDATDAWSYLANEDELEGVTRL